MLINEFYMNREDGVKLYRTFSDIGMMIRKDGTDMLYSEAVDVENSGYAYTETDVPAETEDDLTVQDTLTMLNELGVDTDDR